MYTLAAVWRAASAMLAARRSNMLDLRAFYVVFALEPSRALDRHVHEWHHHPVPQIPGPCRISGLVGLSTSEVLALLCGQGHGRHWRGLSGKNAVRDHGICKASR